jgi:hypothetical protein
VSPERNTLEMRKVEHWISYAAASGKPEAVGGLGGWFGCGENHDLVKHTWQDYLDYWEESVHPYLEALKTDVLVSGRFLCGNQHQDDPSGVPMFDDGTVAVFSFRGWGDLMAAIKTVEDGKIHSYMEFYYA